MAGHPNSLVAALESVGYGLADLLPAYGGRDLVYVDQVLRDRIFCSPIYNWVAAEGYPGMGGRADLLVSVCGGGLDGILYIDVRHYNGRFASHIAASIVTGLETLQ